MYIFNNRCLNRDRTSISIPINKQNASATNSHGELMTDYETMLGLS